ncbi:hypothetical protein BDZ97DRAFT_1761180 [Flammula alnicola]|nr:hypothetical protein BDZ97DRAFT_1761180 [Flammula alnicola]
MYAHPVNHQADRLPPQGNPSKVPFLYRKVARHAVPPISEHSRGSSGGTSEHSDGTVKGSTTSIPSTLTANPMSVTSHGGHSLNSVLAGLQPQDQNVSSSSSLGSSGSSRRVVGRGGIGSRPRAVTSDNLVAQKLQSLAPKPPNPPDQPAFVRPSGRGGLASRPKQLAPPPPPPKSPILNVKQPLPPQERDKQLPTFIRPSGRGGLASRPKPAGAPPTLLQLLHKRKGKSSKKSKGKARAHPTFTHPIPPDLSYEITNESCGTLSTLHFAGESISPPPSFFPITPTMSNSLTSVDDFSFTPPFSPSSSTFDDASSSIQTNPDDDLDVDIYLEETRPSTPDTHRQRSLNKLTRTLGDFPPDILYRGPTGEHHPLQKEPFPMLLVERDPPKKDKSTKAFRRASLSMTSLFVRPSARVRDSVASHHTISTITDDLHRLGLDDDFESWGEVNNSRISPPGTPESPIMFSQPSPAPKGNSKSNLSVALLDADQDDFVPSPTLSRSHSFAHGSRDRTARMSSHAHSASTSLLDDIHPDSHRNLSTPSNWMFPPSGDDEKVMAFSVTRNLSNPEKPLAWSGEWNNDMQDVIKALRNLR